MSDMPERTVKQITADTCADMAKLEEHYWTNKIGQKILISQLEDSHLDNILTMYRHQSPSIERARWEMLGNAYAFQGKCRGDMAMDAMDHEINQIEHMTDDQILCQVVPLFKELLAEHKRRAKTKP